jgi:hypothetical protein
MKKILCLTDSMKRYEEILDLICERHPVHTAWRNTYMATIDQIRQVYTSVYDAIEDEMKHG